MRRRKWWFIALSLTLLAACVGLWRWSEQPPYTFLAGASLWVVSVPPGGKTELYYALEVSPEDVLRGAEAELASSSKSSTGRTVTFTRPSTLGEVEVIPNRHVTSKPAVPPLTRTLVRVTRPTRFRDHLLTLLYPREWTISVP